MTEPAIRTVDLTRTFGALRAVDGLTFEVPAGSVFGFLGPNGAGKTTTIHLLLGLLKPTSGRVEVLGRDPVADGREVRRRVGALLEHHGLYERLSAEDNLLFHARAHRMDEADARRRIQELLEPLGLYARRAELPIRWSRGMKQKLAVARALLHRPPLVLLDEPTAGQDPTSAAEFREALDHLAHQEGTTVFLTTHNLFEAERVCDRVAVVRAGKLLAVGAPDELRGREAVEIIVRGVPKKAEASLAKRAGVERVVGQNGDLHVHLTAGTAPGPHVRWLVEAGADIDEVRRTGSLEDAFLALVKEEPAHA